MARQRALTRTETSCPASQQRIASTSTRFWADVEGILCCIQGQPCMLDSSWLRGRGHIATTATNIGHHRLNASTSSWCPACRRAPSQHTWPLIGMCETLSISSHSFSLPYSTDEDRFTLFPRHEFLQTSSWVSQPPSPPRQLPLSRVCWRYKARAGRLSGADK